MPDLVAVTITRHPETQQLREIILDFADGSQHLYPITGTSGAGLSPCARFEVNGASALHFHPGETECHRAAECGKTP